MKKKYLSVIMAVCVFSAFPTALSCQCVDADCSFVSKTIRAKVPRCHPPVSQTRGGNSSRQECCGKCQIEKAAVLSNGLSPVSDIRHRNTLVEIRSFADLGSQLQKPSFFQREFPESPPGFFAQHILNTTFSFRAPPLAVVL
jgi:hypothetical protein